MSFAGEVGVERDEIAPVSLERVAACAAFRRHHVEKRVETCQMVARLAGKPRVRDRLFVMMMGRRNCSGIDRQGASAQDQQDHNDNRNPRRPAHVSPLGIDCCFARDAWRK